MLPSIIAFPDIFDINIAVLIKIKFLEDSLHQVLPEWAHVTFDCSEEFIKRDVTIVIDVKHIEEVAALLLTELEPEVTETLPELLYLERSVTIIIQNFEYSLQANEAPGASRGQLLPQFRHKLIIFMLNT